MGELIPFDVLNIIFDWLKELPASPVGRVAFMLTLASKNCEYNKFIDEGFWKRLYQKTGFQYNHMPRRRIPRAQLTPHSTVLSTPPGGSEVVVADWKKAVVSPYIAASNMQRERALVRIFYNGFNAVQHGIAFSTGQSPEIHDLEPRYETDGVKSTSPYASRQPMILLSRETAICAAVPYQANYIFNQMSKFSIGHLPAMPTIRSLDFPKSPWPMFSPETAIYMLANKAPIDLTDDKACLFVVRQHNKLALFDTRKIEKPFVEHAWNKVVVSELLYKNIMVYAQPEQRDAVSYELMPTFVILPDPAHPKAPISDPVRFPVPASLALLKKTHVTLIDLCQVWNGWVLFGLRNTQYYTWKLDVSVLHMERIPDQPNDACVRMTTLSIISLSKHFLSIYKRGSLYVNSDAQMLTLQHEIDLPLRPRYTHSLEVIDEASLLVNNAALYFDRLDLTRSVQGQLFKNGAFSPTTIVIRSMFANLENLLGTKQVKKAGQQLQIKIFHGPDLPEPAPASRRLLIAVDETHCSTLHRSCFAGLGQNLVQPSPHGKTAVRSKQYYELPANFVVLQQYRKSQEIEWTFSNLVLPSAELVALLRQWDWNYDPVTF